MINPAIAILSDVAVWAATLWPAIVAFWKARGPWKVWASALAFLAFPSLIVSGLGYSRMNVQALLAPLCIWLAAWAFATAAIKERIRDEQAAN